MGLRATATTRMRSSCADGCGEGTLLILTDRCSASRMSAFMVDGYDATLCATRLTSDDMKGLMG